MITWGKILKRATIHYWQRSLTYAVRSFVSIAKNRRYMSESSRSSATGRSSLADRCTRCTVCSREHGPILRDQTRTAWDVGEDYEERVRRGRRVGARGARHTRREGAVGDAREERDAQLLRRTLRQGAEEGGAAERARSAAGAAVGKARATCG